MAQGNLITNLQFARFVAAFAVVLFHLDAYQPELGIPYVELFGFAGVDVFFVISGYIMWHTTVANPRPPSAVSFVKRRFARIFTGYWPYLIIAIGVFFVLDQSVLAKKDLVGSALLLPIKISDRVIAVSWTLSYELYFYCLFALLLAFRQYNLTWVIPAGVVAMGLYNGIGVWMFDFYSYDFFAATPVYVRFLHSPYLFEFFLGALICRYLPVTEGRYAWLALAAGVGLFAAGAYYNHQVTGGEILQGFHVMERVAFFGAASGALIYGLAGVERKGLALLPAFSRLFGGASYSMYLAHTMVLYAFSKLASGMIELAGALAVILAYSVFHYLYVEQPFYRLARRGLRV